MKRIELFFLGILVPVDYAALFLAGFTAYVLRFSTFSNLLPTTVTIPFGQFLTATALFAFFFVCIFSVAGLYRPSVRRRFAAELPRIGLAVSTGIAVVIVAIFFQRQYFASRFIILAAWAFAFFFVAGGRIFLRLIRYLTVRAGWGIRRVALVGNTSTSQAIIELFHEQHRWASKVVASFSHWNETTKKELHNLRAKHQIDDVILTDASTPRGDINELNAFCDDNHLGFRYTADLLQTTSGTIELLTLAGVPIVSVKRTPLEGWGAIAKRVFDIIGAIVLLIILSPIMFLVALMVRSTSRGPVIYKNERVGARGGHFKLYKFRSMYANVSTGDGLGGAEALAYEAKLIKEKGMGDGPVYKLPDDDPRITPVGRFIRNTSLDELPQLFNVIKGEMSLVGPRPHQPREVAKYLSHHRRVLAIKPGMTGLAQISGRRSLPFDDEVRLDNYYIEHWSPYLDLIIFMKTPLAVFSKKGAY